MHQFLSYIICVSILFIVHFKTQFYLLDPLIHSGLVDLNCENFTGAAEKETFFSRRRITNLKQEQFLDYFEKQHDISWAELNDT